LISKRFGAASVAVLAAAAIAAATVVGTGAAAPSKQSASVTVALISDIGRFNDHGFNQSQLSGLNRAKTVLGIKTIAKQSNSVSDYIPNIAAAVRQHANLVISAGFLLADATAKAAAKFPSTNFAITDYPVEAAPFADKKGKVLYKNVEGLTYAANESGCLVGYLAALTIKRQGKPHVMGAVAGIKIPPVDIWVAGYDYCAKLALPDVKLLLGYSQDFVQADKCATVAQNQITQGAQVLFQVAGGCGLGTLKAADAAGIWGIGVDTDQYTAAGHVLTSAIKRVDVGVYDAAKQLKAGKFLGGSDLNFNLKNGGMGVGKISPSVNRADIAKMNALKVKIIAGTVKVPTALK